ncbi:MAG TPA: DUF308 domain-containing protein [Bacillota bacterium]|nr:DUF308 domain-containing protein [Bacillota bacterium]
MRVLIIVSGGILVLTGVFCFANPGASFLAVAFVLGIVMVLDGVIQTSGYLYGRSGSKQDNNGWIMVDAAITFILGILVLSNQLVAEIAVNGVFGMWALTSGVQRVVTATNIDREEKKKNHYWAMGTGIICVVAGVYAFLDYLLLGIGTVILLGIIFLLQGVSTFELGIHMPHKKK